MYNKKRLFGTKIGEKTSQRSQLLRTVRESKILNIGETIHQRGTKKIGKQNVETIIQAIMKADTRFPFTFLFCFLFFRPFHLYIYVCMDFSLLFVVLIILMSFLHSYSVFILFAHYCFFFLSSFVSVSFFTIRPYFWCPSKPDTG